VAGQVPGYSVSVCVHNDVPVYADDHVSNFW
jgi:hypothetical protein